MHWIGRTAGDVGPYNGLCVGDGIYDVPNNLYRQVAYQRAAYEKTDEIGA